MFFSFTQEIVLFHDNLTSMDGAEIIRQSRGRSFDLDTRKCKLESDGSLHVDVSVLQFNNETGEQEVHATNSHQQFNE